MFLDDTDPSELAFWKTRIVEQSILSAIKIYPDQARRIFGAVPVMRANMLQLSMILAAREILAAPQGQLTFDTDDDFEKQLREALDTLPNEARSIAQEFLSAERHEEIMRQLARKLIRDATGSEPSN